MKNLADISAAQLRRAADIREQVDNLARELHQIFGIGNESTVVDPVKPKRQRKMSAAARANISAAAKLRWATARKAGRNSL